MNNTIEDNYHRCLDLGKKGDWDSLSQLMQIYLNAEDNRMKKDARKALQKSFNRKAVIATIYNYLENAKSITEKLNILQMGILIERDRFLYEFLMTFRELKPKISKQIIEDIKLNTPFTAIEQSEIVRYIVDSRDFSIILFRELQESYSEKVQEAIIRSIQEGFVSRSMLGIIELDPVYLKRAQDPLYKYIKNNPDESQKFIHYLDLALMDNRHLVNASSDLFSIFKAVSHNIQRGTELKGDTELDQLAIAVVKGHMLSDRQWCIVKQEIDFILNHVYDINRIDSNFYLFMRAISKLDQNFAEGIYISMYERSGMYSGRILNEMTEMHLPYAYRVLTQRLITAKNETAQIQVIAKLLKYYSEKNTHIFEYVQEINNDNVTNKFYEFIQRYSIDISKKDDIRTQFVQGQKFKLIDRNIVISELLSQIANNIHATMFFAAVGFAYCSGFKMLRTTFNQVINNGGSIELILGSLQNYQIEGRNSKIDRISVSYLNQMISNDAVSLYTYSSTFYHGKFYYIANEELAYIIIGSSNISKTAYLSNYELDSLFEVKRGSQEDLEFIYWYKGFKHECNRIYTLDETQFEDFNWRSEQQAFDGRKVKAMSFTEVRNRITSLTDEETRKRLEIWISYNPTEIYSSLGIKALEDYIVFLYDENGLAVFESFITGNAYYTFRYDDFEQLLSQLSGLSKTKMILASEFLMRGYHIQDKDRLEGKIAKLFSFEE